MRENKLEPVPPQLTPDVGRVTAKADEEPADEGAKPERKAADVKEARAAAKKATSTH